MVTRKLYYEDQYMREFKARIIRSDDLGNKRWALVLDASAFYPGGGGQPYDTGVLEGENWVLSVDKVYMDNDLIVHEGVLEGSGKPVVGQMVYGRLDWDRRYRIMRMHTAAHIIGCVIKKMFNADFHGGAINIDISYDDYTARIKRDDLPEIERRANEIVEAGLPHIVHWMPRDKAIEFLAKYNVALTQLHEGLETIRILEIKGLCAYPCGGTHVSNTKEVGRIKILKRESKGRGITRIRYTIEP